MTSFRIVMPCTNSIKHIHSLAYFFQLHLVFEVDHLCWLINSIFLCSIKSPNADVETARNKNTDDRNGTREIIAILGHRHFQSEQ